MVGELCVASFVSALADSNPLSLFASTNTNTVRVADEELLNTSSNETLAVAERETSLRTSSETHAARVASRSCMSPKETSHSSRSKNGSRAVITLPAAAWSTASTASGESSPRSVAIATAGQGRRAASASPEARAAASNSGDDPGPASRSAPDASRATAATNSVVGSSAMASSNTLAVAAAAARSPRLASALAVRVVASSAARVAICAAKSAAATSVPSRYARAARSAVCAPRSAASLRVSHRSSFPRTSLVSLARPGDMASSTGAASTRFIPAESNKPTARASLGDMRCVKLALVHRRVADARDTESLVKASHDGSAAASLSWSDRSVSDIARAGSALALPAAAANKRLSASAAKHVSAIFAGDAIAAPASSATTTSCNARIDSRDGDVHCARASSRHRATHAHAKLNPPTEELGDVDVDSRSVNV